MFLFFTLPMASFAKTYEPNTGHLRGFIFKSDDKTPLWGAQVLLQDVKTRQVFRSNVTDSLGDYEVLNVPAGDYLVIILKTNKLYKVKRVDFLIKIFEEKTTTISFSLKKSVLGFLLFLLRPCGVATVVSVAAIGLLLGKKVEEECICSPTQR